MHVTTETPPDAGPASEAGGLDAAIVGALLRVANALEGAGDHPDVIRRAIARRGRVVGKKRPNTPHRRGVTAASLAAARLEAAGFAVRGPKDGYPRRRPRDRHERNINEALAILRRADEGISPEMQKEMREEMERELDSHRPPGQKLFS